MSKRTTLILAVIGALLATAGVATAISTNGSEGKPATPAAQLSDTQDPAFEETMNHLADAASARPPSAVPDAISDGFAVFRRSMRAGDAGVQEIARQARQMGANPDLGRQVIAARDDRADRSPYYAIPAYDEMICFVDRSASGGCTSVDDIKATGTFGTNECVEKDDTYFVTLHGLVPDGVTAVTLKYPDGTARNVAVTGNGWYAEAPQFPATGRPVAVAFAGSDRSLPLPYSPDVDRGC